MIVMKFGGSSLESGESIRRVTEIVKSQLSRRPVVVVSAMGQTTDRLVDLAAEAAHSHSYNVWKRLKELQEFHLEEAAKAVDGEALEALEFAVHKQLTQLCRLIFETSDEGREFTAALRDEIVSMGERISSLVVAAALNSAGVDAVHLDARKVILTDGKHTCATPLYWETYARLRRTIPGCSKRHTVVMGGFIGATEKGVTTTLGRGGSDLTASIVGAGISAEEIQIWTDVDGMLTSDPRVFGGGYRVRSLSYDEATAMARAGAKVLHPDTALPAVRQRIPIVIRNTRRPECEGTRIVRGAAACTNPVKSIACKQDVTILELRSREGAGFVESLEQLCERLHVNVEMIAQEGDLVYLAVKELAPNDPLNAELDRSVEARVRTHQGMISLIGEGVRETPAMAARVLAALNNPAAFIIPDKRSPIALTVAVPQGDLRRSAELLHRELFRQVDERAFAPKTAEAAGVESVPAVAGAGRDMLRKWHAQFVLARQH